MKISSFDIQNKFLIYRLPSILMPKSMYQDIENVFSIIHKQEINGVFIDFSNVDTIITDGLSILNKILKGILLLGASCSISSVPSHLAQPLSEYLEKLPNIDVVTNFSEFVSKTSTEKTDKEFYSSEILQKIYGKDAASGKFLSHIDKLSLDKKSIETFKINNQTVNAKNENAIMNNLVTKSGEDSKNKEKTDIVKPFKNVKSDNLIDHKQRETINLSENTNLTHKKDLSKEHGNQDDIEGLSKTRKELELKKSFVTYYNKRLNTSKEYDVFTNYYSKKQEKTNQKMDINKEISTNVEKLAIKNLILGKNIPKQK